MKTLNTLVASTLILFGCGTGNYRYTDKELEFQVLSGKYSMSEHTYNILLSKLRTDNEGMRHEINPVAYNNTLRPETNPELWDYVLTKADRDNDHKITCSEARCLEDDIWIEEF
ncbi:MAG TPA: hypothetical protein VI775_01695 [Candidatus Paceibacterota bacterium]